AAGSRGLRPAPQDDARRAGSPGPDCGSRGGDPGSLRHRPPGPSRGARPPRVRLPGQPDRLAVTLPNTLEIEAPAKVNLSLRVLQRRQDGFHDIDSVVAPISLADRLLIHAHADPSQFRTLSLSLHVVGEADLI